MVISQRLIVPTFAGKIFDFPVLYFGDEHMTSLTNDIKKEFKTAVGNAAENQGIKFSNISYTTSPPFGNLFPYHVIFLDWGGLDNLEDGDLIDGLCRSLLRKSEEMPSKSFVICSEFTLASLQDISRAIKDYPCNLFLCLDDYLKTLLQKA